MIGQVLTIPFNLVSHVRHEGVPSFSMGEWGTVTVCTEAYATYVLCIPSGRTQMDLRTHYGVYFFDFTEWHYRIRIYGRLSTSECSWVIPVLCVRTPRRYGQGTTTTTMYIIQLFIRKCYHYKINCTISQLIFSIVTCFLVITMAGTWQ